MLENSRWIRQHCCAPIKVKRVEFIELLIYRTTNYPCHGLLGSIFEDQL
jgi:hypothetical protein